MTIFGLQFKKILLLVLILFSISSCDPGCVEADEFDVEEIIVNARPTGDGIVGKYSSKTGGQVAEWHDTGLRTNGEPIKILVGGAWGAWEQVNNVVALNAAPECKLCFRKEGVNNCICQNGENSIPEKDSANKDKTSDCSGSNQDNPDLCSCTKFNNYQTEKDTAINRFNYVIALDYQNKDGSLKTPDEQQFCKYRKGVGLYLGIFGTTGVINPSRAYHLFSIEEICDIKRDKEGKCIDTNGSDRAKYLYVSPNNRIFMKDDMAGNNGSDTNTNDDQYHKAKEAIKVIIFDRYYDDNFGYYTLNFISGIQRAQDRGLLEFIVGSVEDVMLGKLNPDSNRREGGIVEFLYKSIVKDSSVMLIIRLCLILYVTIFGIGVLAGVVEISRKEISNRVIKIGLVIFFTTETSWYWYDHIVVNFFKDSMDYIISIFMSFTDQIYGDDTSMVKIAQMQRAESASNATRFSYVDVVIKKLFSIAVTKKIWGLFLVSLFGILYIIVTYFLIAYFVYVSVTAALIYITAMLQLVFVIALGPLFILSSLFNQTSVMFKKWLSFMGARSLEVILLFITFYLFLVLIDKGFMDLLSIKSCTSKLVVGFFSIDILKAETDRSFVGWIVSFINIGLLIFLLQTIMGKISGVSNALLSISGTASRTGSSAFGSANSSATGLANNIMSDIVSSSYSAIKSGLSGAGTVARALGVGKVLEAIGDAIPFRGPRGLMRDSIIDGSIKEAMASGKKSGLSGQKLDEHVRKSVTDSLAKQGLENDTKFSMLGINQKSIENRLDQKLVQEPLKKFIKSEAARLKKEGTPLFGKEMTNQIKENARKWADSNLHDKSSVENHLRDMKGLMKEHGTYTPSEAVKKFSKNSDHRNKYLEHTEAQILKDKAKYDNKKFGGIVRAYRDLFGGALHNPNRSQMEFLRQEHYNKLQVREGRGAFAKILGINTAKGWSLNKRIGLFDRKINKDELEKVTKKDLQITKARTDFIHNGFTKELNGIKKRYEDEKEKIRKGESSYSIAEIEKIKRKEEERLAYKIQDYTKLELVELDNRRKADLALSDEGKKKSTDIPEDQDPRVKAKKDLDSAMDEFKKGNGSIENIEEAAKKFKDQLPQLDKDKKADENKLIKAKEDLDSAMDEFKKGNGSAEDIEKAARKFKDHLPQLDKDKKADEDKLVKAKEDLDSAIDELKKGKGSVENIEKASREFKDHLSQLDKDKKADEDKLIKAKEDLDSAIDGLKKGDNIDVVEKASEAFKEHIPELDKDKAMEPIIGTKNGIDDLIQAKSNLDSIVGEFGEGKKSINDVENATKDFKNNHKEAIKINRERLIEKLKGYKSELENLKHDPIKNAKEIKELELQIDMEEARISRDDVKLAIMENREE